MSELSLEEKLDKVLENQERQRLIFETLGELIAGANQGNGKRALLVFKSVEVVKADKQRKNCKAFPSNQVITQSVYFIQAKCGGAVKIGLTSNLDERLKALQASSPVLLRVVRVIKNASLETERNLHNQFNAHRLHGEWFSEEILELI